MMLLVNLQTEVLIQHGCGNEGVFFKITAEGIVKGRSSGWRDGGGGIMSLTPAQIALQCSELQTHPVWIRKGALQPFTPKCTSRLSV